MDHAAANKRWYFVDLAKGVAAFLMILGHAQIFFDPLCYFPVAPAGSYPNVENPMQFILYVIQSSVDAFYFCAGLALGRKVALVPDATSWLHAWTLIKRGVVLLLIDLALISWCYLPKGNAFEPIFGSIACFGVCFILMAGLQKLRPMWLLILAFAILVAREIVILPYPFEDPLYGIFYGMFWGPANEAEWSSLFVISAWLPVILMGFIFGYHLVRRPSLQNTTVLFGATVGFALLFAVIRGSTHFGSFGQPLPTSAIQFFLLSKYPASLQFHLLNMSFCFLYLWIGKVWEDSAKLSRARAWTAVCGRQIFFVYIFHLLFFGVARHVFGFTPETGSLGQSMAWFVMTTLLAIRMAYFYDAIKLRFGKKYSMLRYV
jgi:uncharacterized membrane protein